MQETQLRLGCDPRIHYDNTQRIRRTRSIVFSLLCSLPWCAELLINRSPFAIVDASTFLRAIRNLLICTILWPAAMLILNAVLARTHWKILRPGAPHRPLAALPLVALVRWSCEFPSSRFQYLLISAGLVLLFALIFSRLAPFLDSAAWNLNFIPGRVRSLLMGFTLLGLIVIFFGPVFFEGKVISPNGFLYIWPPFRSYAPPGPVDYNPITSDFTDSLFPQYAALRSAIHSTGRMPWTNDGTLSVENYATFLGSSFYSFDFLLINIFGISWGATAAVLIRYLVGGIFTFLFMRLHQIDRTIALLSAVLFMFSAFSVVNTFLPYLFSIPLLMYCTELLLQRRRFTCTPPMILAYVLALVSGQIIWSIHLFTLQILYVFFAFATRRELWPSLGRLLGMFFFSGLASLLLLSFLVLPSIEHYQALDLGYRAGNSGHFQPFEFAFMFLFPLAAGPMTSIFTWGGNAVEYSFYVGAASVLLLTGVLARPSKTTGLFLVAASLCIYAITTNAFGVLSWVRRVPFYNSSSNTRLRFLWSFTMTVGAGFGLAALIALAKTRPWRALGIVLSTAAAILILIYDERSHFLSGDTEIKFSRPDIAGHMYWQTVLILALIFTLVLILMSRRRTFFMLLLVGLSFVDLFANTAEYVSFLDPALNYPPMRATDFLKNRLEKTAGRIMPLQRAFIAHFSMPYDIPSIQPRGFYTRREKMLFQLLDPQALAIHPTMYFFDEAQTNFQSPLLDLLNVRALIFTPGDNGRDLLERLGDKWKLVYNDEVRIYENQGSPQPAFAAPLGEVVSDVDQTARRMAGIEPAKTALFESDDALWPRPIAESQRDDFHQRIVLASRSHDRYVFDTQTSAQSYLVYSRFYHPAWKAYVDDVQVPVYRADLALMGVRLPAGDHVVRFEFHPRFLGLGLTTSALTAMMLCVLYAAILLKARRPKPPPLVTV